MDNKVNQEAIDRAMQILRSSGDARYGGSLPLGGKAFGGSVDYSKYGGDPAVRAPAIPYPGNLLPSERKAYDAWMNLHESKLQDLLGVLFYDAYDKAKKLPPLK